MGKFKISMDNPSLDSVQGSSEEEKSEVRELCQGFRRV